MAIQSASDGGCNDICGRRLLDSICVARALRCVAVVGLFAVGDVGNNRHHHLRRG